MFIKKKHFGSLKNEVGNKRSEKIDSISLLLFFYYAAIVEA